MQVGLFINTQFPEGNDVAARVPEMVEQVRVARDAGFKSLWFPHHWLTYPMQMLQITPVMGYIAAHAQGMTIGPNILILPPQNPMHVAEEAATLDVLTGGNYVLGLGLGYRQPEFDAFGIPLSERAPRFNESIGLMKRLWTEDKVTHQGPVLYRQRRGHRCEADPRGRAAAVYRGAGGCVGETRGADRRRVADRQQQRPEQDHSADENLSRRAGGIRTDRDGFPDHRRMLCRRSPRHRARGMPRAVAVQIQRLCRVGAGGPSEVRDCRSRISPATNSSSATRFRSRKKSPGITNSLASITSSCAASGPACRSSGRWRRSGGWGRFSRDASRPIGVRRVIGRRGPSGVVREIAR